MFRAMLAKTDFYFLIFNTFFFPMNYDMDIFNFINYHFRLVQKMLWPKANVS